MRNSLLLAGVVAGFSAALAGGCDWPGFGGLGTGGTSGQGGQPATGETAPWVIILQEFAGPGRQGQAEQARRVLAGRGWGGVGVLHESNEQRSYVYLGPYHPNELAENLKQVRAYTDAAGNRPFVAAYDKKLPPPTPPAPSEWNLANAPKEAFWSLQVGIYVEPGPSWPVASELVRKGVLPADWNRKKEAVDACKALREMGLEAYYYHGPNMSVVTIGSFPAEVYRYHAHPTRPRSEGYDPATDEFKDPRVNKVRNMVLKDAQGRDDRPFRYYCENGMKIAKGEARGERRVPPSFLVQIPRAGQDLE